MKTVPLFEPGRTDRILAPLGLLERCGGFYKCPKDTAGKRLGPLVGYAGRDESGRQYVGDVYVNFAKAERHAPILDHLAHNLINRIYKRNLGETLKGSDGFCAAPEGGKALACHLAKEALVYEEGYGQYIFPEKEITAVSTLTSREVSRLIFDRHEPEEGEKWWITEDVCNNFSTTAKLVELIESHGAVVVGVVCFLNRSNTVDMEFNVADGRKLPVVPLVRMAFPQYTQDDPFVAADIAEGNVVWKPKKKDEWKKLADAMDAAKK
jgi:orotate phosphoribosyltransferase